jgi:hypothetical protein
MGQYYKPTILTKRNGIHGWWYSHECAQITEFPHGTFPYGKWSQTHEHSCARIRLCLK